MKAFFERKFKFGGKLEWVNPFMAAVIAMLAVFIFLGGFYNYNSTRIYKNANLSKAKSVMDTTGFMINLLKDRGSQWAFRDESITSSNPQEPAGYKTTIQEFVNEIAKKDPSLIKIFVASGPMLTAESGKTNVRGLYSDRNWFRNGQVSMSKRRFLVEEKKTDKEFYILSRAFRFRAGKYDNVKLTKLVDQKFNGVPKLAFLLGLMIVFSIVNFLLMMKFKKPQKQFMIALISFGLYAFLTLIFAMNFSKADYDINSKSKQAYYNQNISLMTSIIKKNYPNARLNPADMRKLVSSYNRNLYYKVDDGFTFRPPSKVMESPRAYEKHIQSNLGYLFAGWLFSLIIAIPMLIFWGRKMGFERMLNKIYNATTAYAFVSPGIIAMLILVFIPIVFTLILGFTAFADISARLNIGRFFVGFDNFFRILGVFDLHDPLNFYYTLFFTIGYTIVAVTIQTTLGVVIAVILNQEGLEIKGFYQVIFMLPWIIPTYISGLLWRNIFSTTGVLNQIIQVLTGTAQKGYWLQDPTMGFFLVSFVSAWYAFPFIMLVTMSALQTIPKSLFEAAMIDGANWFQRLFSIILPMIRPTVLPTVLLTSIWTFNQFNLVYLFTGGDDRFDILVTRIYDFVDPNRALSNGWNYGFAATYSTLIFVILLVYIYIFAKGSNLTEKSF